MFFSFISLKYICWGLTDGLFFVCGSAGAAAPVKGERKDGASESTASRRETRRRARQPHPGHHFDFEGFEEEQDSGHAGTELTTNKPHRP